MSTLSITDYVIMFVFVVAAFGVVNLLRSGLAQWLKWDIGERERVLQQRLSELTTECDKYKDEVSSLRKQIQIMVGQYDDIVIKYNDLNQQYLSAKEEAVKLREQLDRWRADLRESDARFNRILIAAVGMPEASGNMDMASLRAVKMDTGMSFEHIQECTPEKLQSSLDSARGMQAVTYLHLSIKSDKDGYQLMDKIVDANWLSANLQGVIICLIAGSDSTEIGEFIGVVPYLITMSDKLPSKEAARFTRYFWTEIGKGIGPSLAFNRAIDRSPGRMSEYVKRHWLE